MSTEGTKHHNQPRVGEEKLRRMTVEGWRATLVAGFTQFGPVLKNAERSPEVFVVSANDGESVVEFDGMSAKEDVDEDVHDEKRVRVD